MNFLHYYQILQTEKPNFVFEQISDLEAIKKEIANFEKYFVHLPATEKRKCYNVAITKLQLCFKSKHLDTLGFVKFYDLPNFYSIYGQILFKNEDHTQIFTLVQEINACKDHFEAGKNCQNLLLTINPDKNLYDFDLWNIAQKSKKQCYFNLINTKKDYFILEMITIIDKIIP
ncbi:MAG: hypothetical protein EAZ97_03020 [Bacteroidetes bacterium]|nr:MAG: hypothetical protein EAZ97_03020 [Bacteroidota bacterium]